MLRVTESCFQESALYLFQGWAVLWNNRWHPLESHLSEWSYSKWFSFSGEFTFTKLPLGVSSCFWNEQIVRTTTCFLSFSTRKSIPETDIHKFRNFPPLCTTMTRPFQHKIIFDHVGHLLLRVIRIRVKLSLFKNEEMEGFRRESRNCPTRISEFRTMHSKE